MSSYQRSWIPIHSPSPTVSIVLLGLAVGSGGTFTPLMLKQRAEVDSLRSGVSVWRVSEPAAAGIAIEFQMIRDTMRMSVAELARMFGVSRPTIYNWQRGGAIEPVNESRVREIASALEPHLPLLQQQTGRPALRPIDGGRCLIDLLAQGRSAADAVAKLLSILSEENSQRNRLATRLQSRRSNRGAADLDAMS